MESHSNEMVRQRNHLVSSLQYARRVRSSSADIAVCEDDIFRWRSKPEVNSLC